MGTALIVDDDPEIRNVLARTVEYLGLQFEQAENGRLAIECLSAKSYEVVLLDIAMPEINGLEVLEWMRDTPPSPAPAVIIITAFADAQAKVTGTDLGAFDFVEKPFRVQDLQRRIRRALSLVDMERRLSQAEDDLQRLREVDPVTGFETTGQLYRALETAYEGAQESNGELACVVVSDEMYTHTLRAAGRGAGNERLQNLANKIEGNLGVPSRVFRVDAAEFVVLMPGITSDKAREVVSGIQRAAEDAADLGADALTLAVAVFPHPEIKQAAGLFRAASVTLAKARTRLPRVAYFEGF